MKFICNDEEWEIEEVSQEKMTCLNNDYTKGLTVYMDSKIYLLEGQKDIIRTLKHELAHVWLFEHGHAQVDDMTYTYEEVCDIIACSNKFINKVVFDYMERGKDETD